jgi:protein-disulfide isomerase
MTKRVSLIVLMLLFIPLLITGCVDKKKVDGIAETQKEILTTLKSIEGKIGNLAKAAPAPAPSRPTIDYNKVNNLPIGSSAIKGNKNAPVTIVEFSDYQCPYCSRLQPTLTEVLKAYPKDVKLVFKDFPLSFHKEAKNAAKAARAAGEQGKYWEMHDLIFEKFSTVNEAMFKEFAGKLNLDLNKFNADYSSTKYDQLIQQDINMGRTAGVTGTPSLFLNGKRMQRRSFEDFKTEIDAIIAKK